MTRQGTGRRTRVGSALRTVLFGGVSWWVRGDRAAESSSWNANYGGAPSGVDGQHLPVGAGSAEHRAPGTRHPAAGRATWPVTAADTGAMPAFVTSIPEGRGPGPAAAPGRVSVGDRRRTVSSRVIRISTCSMSSGRVMFWPWIRSGRA